MQVLFTNDMQLQVARHLFISFHDIKWNWESLTDDEKLIHPNQDALNTLQAWVTKTLVVLS